MARDLQTKLSAGSLVHEFVAFEKAWRLGVVVWVTEFQAQVFWSNGFFTTVDRDLFGGDKWHRIKVVVR